ncbi:MAG: DUF1684 domain-containing protein [Bryobacteraceae bacterium]
MRRTSGLMLVAIGILAAADSYEGEILRWRADREAKLKADGSWLTVAGLFWLKEGVNTAGTDPSHQVVLPPGSAPAKVGRFERNGSVTRFVPEAGAGVTRGGKPANPIELKPNVGLNDSISVRDLTMFVIERGERIGIRLIDRNSPLRRRFTSLRWYPVDRRYRVIARWTPYPAGKTIRVPNVLGMVEHLPCPGIAEFALDGTTVRLEPVLEDNELFFIFKDGTSGKETYPPGRFLYAALPENGRVDLDFNKAYNPPCAFTPYATCPLPPKQNHVAAAIRAGEMRYGASH